jgi:hypothetical protein
MLHEDFDSKSNMRMMLIRMKNNEEKKMLLVHEVI